MAKQKLSSEIVAQFPAYLDEWKSIGLTTEPIDRAAAVAAIHTAYSCAGKETPKLFIHVTSPLQGIISAYILSHNWASIRNIVMYEFCASARNKPFALVEVSNNYRKLKKNDAALQTLLERTPLTGQLGVDAYLTAGKQLIRDLVALLQARYPAYLSGEYDFDKFIEVLPGEVGYQVNKEVKDEPRDKFWEEVITETKDSWPAMQDQLWASVKTDQGADVAFQQIRAFLTKVDAGLWAPIQNEIWERLSNIEAKASEHSLTIPSFNDIWEQIHLCGYGSQDADWLSFYAFFSKEVGLECGKQLIGLRQIIHECGWWWPFENACVLTDRPTEVHFDAQDRTHMKDAPAIAYADGFAVYLWRGRRVERSIIMDDVDVKRIDNEANAENRRILVERYGAKEYVRDSNLDPVHSDDWGTLFRKEQEGDDPIYVVKVICPTTGREYYLGVDPAAYEGRAGKESRAAVASTWRNLDNSLAYATPEEYSPEIET